MILHFSQIFFTEGLTFIVKISFLFRTPCYTTLRRIVYRHLDGDLVAYEDPDVILSELAGDMSGYYHIVRQFHLEGRVRKRFRHDALKFDHIIFRQNDPSSVL